MLRHCLLFLILLIGQTTFSQKVKLPKNKLHLAFLKGEDFKLKNTFLFEVTDTSLFLVADSDRLVFKTKYQSQLRDMKAMALDNKVNYQFYEVPIQKLKKVVLREREFYHSAKYFPPFAGALVGMLYGVGKSVESSEGGVSVVGFSSIIIIYGGGGMLAGTMVKHLTNIFNFKKFNWKYNQRKFDEQKVKMRKYSLLIE